ncbi:MAG TPA: hypothetical protein VLR46_12070 [Candidatus Dormibacteraeota bacterium]|nr:hypothetical protein [Candidatus Dormibacteraeota bacterium]
MKRKVAVALCVGLLFYALSDILLWQRIFEAHDLFQYDVQYQSGHVSTLVAMIAVGVVLLWDARLWALWYAAAFYTLTFSGLEDVLYYWLDGHKIPASCPWLNNNPFILFKPAGGWSLAASALIWIAFWAATLWAIPVAQSAVRGAKTLGDRTV